MGLSPNVGPFRAYLPPSRDDLHQPRGPAPHRQLRTQTHCGKAEGGGRFDISSCELTAVSLGWCL